MYDTRTFQKSVLFIHKQIDFWFECFTYKFRHNIIQFQTTGKVFKLELQTVRCQAQKGKSKTAFVFACHREAPFSGFILLKGRLNRTKVPLAH